jgi:hypothetical protein
LSPRPIGKRIEFSLSGFGADRQRGGIDSFGRHRAVAQLLKQLGRNGW